MKFKSLGPILSAALIIFILLLVNFCGCTKVNNLIPDDGDDQTDIPIFSHQYVSDHGSVDFAFVEADGTYHLIGIDPSAELLGNTDKYGFYHASSPDMIEWTEHENILNITENADATWAPSIIKIDNIWFMYYTVVEWDDELRIQDPNRVQSIWLVTSTDLFNWSDPQFILDGTSEFTTWGTGIPWGDDFRDPHVFTTNDGFGMVVSARSSENPLVMNVVYAESIDGYDWTIVSEFENIRSGFAESPFMLIRGDDQYLFWTPNNGKCEVLKNGVPTYSRDGGKACEILKRDRNSYWFAYLEITSIDYETGLRKLDVKIEVLMFDEDGNPWTIDEWKKGY